jgi:hypothetical protein
MGRKYRAFDQMESGGENGTKVISCRSTVGAANHLIPSLGFQRMNWRKRIKRGEKVGLELTQTERKLLLTGLVFMHERVEKAIKSTPPGDKMMLSLSDLEDLVGHVAGEANHAKSERIEEILSGVFDKIEELLDQYAEEDEQTRG